MKKENEDIVLSVLIGAGIVYIPVLTLKVILKFLSN